MESSLFGKLSPELRNSIYKLVLHDPDGFKIFQHDGTHPDSGLPDGKAKGINLYFSDKLRVRDALAITECCNGIRSETLSMFYYLNTFTLCYASASHSVGKWSAAMKTTYESSIKACRDWLRTLPASASGVIDRLYIAHDGGEAYTPGPRPTYWWNDARRVEKALLYQYLQPSSIHILVQFKCYEYEFNNHLRRRSSTGQRGMCHLDIQKECSLVVYDVPTHDNALAKVAIESTYADQVAKIEARATEYGCCIGVEKLKNSLLKGASDGRKLMLQAVGK
ncbi:hypothetical protein LTR56_025285 [Elasticomyces elasticus]|nr:hypothetical protein LTR56_025285 [Elasticomyces elasticus]KAK3653767.1 hypothetical protein LTR22_010982 [Elasticomyces elasticus]KAK4904987.1 hypothetical protein LTR49_025666 [Elasticomyces elasticus]KAK5741005.1 hypothetical protein LTS12_024764 [Elasticomyces elasticus]